MAIVLIESCIIHLDGHAVGSIVEMHLLLDCYLLAACEQAAKSLTAVNITRRRIAVAKPVKLERRLESYNVVLNIPGEFNVSMLIAE